MATSSGRPGATRGVARSRVAPSSHLRVVDAARRRRTAVPRRRPRTRSAAPRTASARVTVRSQSRLIAVFILVILAFGGMAYRLVQVQVLQADRFQALAAEQRERDIEIPARRGTIFDRNGQPLGISVDLNMVYTDPAWVEDPVATAAQVSKVLKLDPAEVEAKLRGSVPGDRFEYLARQVQPKVAKKVAALDLPGIYLKTEPKRYYPGGRLASHVLGFVNVDGTVRAGIEAQYQSVLRGEPGHLTLEQDPTGRALPQAEFEERYAEPGRELILTLDKDLQHFTELTLASAAEQYGARAGTAIVLHVGSGEILAMANFPDFDPNRPGKAPVEAQRNLAVTDMYEPGSAFKIVTMAAAIEENVVTPKTKFVVPDAFQYLDRVFNDSHSHPTETMTVSRILKESSNVGTIKVGLELGDAKLDEWVRRFGFGSKTGLDFPGEAAGITLPRESWSGTTIATVPIGQGVAVTPLQMVNAYATLANDGVMTEPKLVHATMGATGRTVLSAAAARRRVVSKQTANTMRRLLVKVVDKGTGVEAQIPGYKVAGKTGTAQKPLPGGGYGSSYIASFAGFAPADDPLIAAIVVLDNPQPIWGGLTAAPTFQTVVEYALRHLGASPSADAEKAARQIEEEQAGESPAHD